VMDKPIKEWTLEELAAERKRLEFRRKPRRTPIDVTDVHGFSDTPRLSVTPCSGCGAELGVMRAGYCGDVCYDYGSYCSMACYERSLRLRHRFKELTCETCGAEFVSTRIDAHFCSNACRQKHWREETLSAGDRLLRDWEPGR
jgi:hypothetical protein